MNKDCCVIKQTTSRDNTMRELFERFVEYVTSDKYAQAIAWICTVLGCGIIAVISLLKKLFSSKDSQTVELGSQCVDNNTGVSNNTVAEQDFFSNKNHTVIGVNTDSSDNMGLNFSLTTIPASSELIGRDKIINEIESKMVSNAVIVLHSGGGVGKTVIAARLCNKVKNRETIKGLETIRHVAWINSSADIFYDFLQLNIPLSSMEENDKEKIEEISRWLSNPINSTLIVIDNFDRPFSLDERNFLNTIAGNTKILVTSRVYDNCFTGIKIDPLGKKHCIDLFLKYYTELSMSGYATLQKDSEEYNIIEEIVERSYRNALLIELIAKMASAETVSLKQLWNNLLEKNVLKRDSEIIIDSRHAESHGLDPEKDNLTLQEQIKRLYIIAGLSENQLNIMQFFSAFPSGVKVYKDIIGWMKFSQSDVVWLLKRGWLIWNEDSYMTHPMIRNSIILQNTEIPYNVEPLMFEMLTNLNSNIENYIPDVIGSVKARERASLLQTIGNMIEEYNISESEKAKLFSNLGRILTKQGGYLNAILYYQKSLDIVKTFLGECCLETGNLLNSMSITYDLIGDYGKGIECCLLAIDIFQKTVHINSLCMASAYNNLATLYNHTGKYSEAIENYNTAYALLSISPERDEEILSSIESGIAQVCNILGDPGTALDLCRNDLEKTIEKYGEDHPLTATSFNNLSQALCGVGDFVEAEYYCQKAIEIREKHQGKDHPDTAVVYDNMAIIYDEMGKHSEALDYNLLAISIFERTLDENHPEIATAYNNSGMIYSHMGNTEEALKQYCKALSIREKVLGNNHLATARIINNIAVLYDDQKQFDSAYKYYKKAHEIMEKQIEQQNPEFIKVCVMMGDVLLHLNRTDEATAIFYKVNKILDDYYEKDNPFATSIKRYISDKRMLS